MFVRFLSKKMHTASPHYNAIYFHTIFFLSCNFLSGPVNLL